MSIVAQRVVGSRLGRFGELIEFVIDGFGQDNFRLYELFVIGSEVQRSAFVKDGDLAIRLLADRDLGSVQGIGGPPGSDLVDNLLVLHGMVLGVMSSSHYSRRVEVENLVVVKAY